MGKTVWLIPALLFSCSGFAQQAANAGQAQDLGPVSSAPAPQKLTVPSGVMQGNRTGGNMPVYPAIAKAAGVQGTVVLRATISKDGTIEDLKVISGPPMLQAAATDAVRTWSYKPYRLNGEPVEVETQINVVFSLGSAPPAGAPQRAPSQEPPANPFAVQITGVAQPQDQPPPEHPITPDQVHQIMQLTRATTLTRQMLDSLMPAVRQSMPPYMPADVLEDFENTFLGGNLDALMVREYQAHVSTEDAAAVIAFYQTPAGQRFVAATPVILKETQAAAGELALQIFEEVMERHKLEIDAAKQKYEMDHPWAVPKN